MIEGNDKLIVFQNKKIRRVWFRDEWYFSVVDVVEALTGSISPTDYLKKLRKRDAELGFYIGTNCPQVEILTETNKKRLTLAGNTKDIFRIIQSIPSKNAEPFKQWLSQVGYERIQEIQNPELAQLRMKELYKQKGYSDDWIEKRVRGIAVRDELTDEWKKRDVKTDLEYAILTSEISKATFGLTPTQYKDLKGLDKENLRDHMNDLELIFTMLDERVTTEIARNKDTKGFVENKDAAVREGRVAGKARRDTEEETGKSVVSRGNYLEEPESVKKKKIGRK